jgi:hypothetical protein
LLRPGEPITAGRVTAMIWCGQIGVILLAPAVSVLLAHRFLHLRSADLASARSLIPF